MNTKSQSNNIREEWHRDLLPKFIDENEYNLIRKFWSEFGRKPVDYFNDIEIQWYGYLKNGQDIWVDPSEDFIPRFSVRPIKGWKKAKFVHRWNNMASAYYKDGSSQTISCGGDFFDSNADLINHA